MTDNGSIRSSEGTCSSMGDERERAKIVQKIIEIKEKLKTLNEKSEADVVKFLNVTRQSEKQRGIGSDNPQLVRIRNNFERSNRKHSQETEILQKKLIAYEERLKLVDSGEYEPSPSRTAVLSQGIRKAGANVKEMTETVITAPMEFAQRLKTAFGSADNLNVSKESGARLGHSTFFTNRRSADTEETELPDKKTHSSVRGSSTLPPNLSLSSCDPVTISKNNHQDDETPSRPGSSEDGNMSNLFQTANNSLSIPHQNFVIDTPIGTQSEFLPQLNENLKSIMLQIKTLDDKHERLKNDVAHEIAFYADALEEERFKITKLEKLLNDTIELHQVEFESLKEQNLMATRVDYQHNDRFKNVEEKMESLHNHLMRVENTIADSMDVSLTSPIWRNALLSGANIAMEFTKLILFATAGALELGKNILGSRNRAGVFYLVSFVVLIIGWQVLKYYPTIYSSAKITNSTGQVNGDN